MARSMDMVNLLRVAAARARAAFLNMVDDKGVNCSLSKGFREFCREILTETRLLCGVQSSLFSWVHSLGWWQDGCFSRGRNLVRLGGQRRGRDFGP